MEKILVDILGISSTQTSGGAYTLILNEVDGKRRLPIVVGSFEAQAIALELEKIKPPRPLTHDLIKNIVEALEVNLTEIVINDLKDGTYYAYLTIDNQEIDARPSDAIALAVRFGVSIYVSEEVMKEASFLQDEEETEPDFVKEELINSKLEELQKKLNDAIQKEDYEFAAKLRDEIKKLQ